MSLVSAAYILLVEFGEIVSMSLTPWKSHDDLIVPIRLLNQAYNAFGMDKVKLYYTNNVNGDRDFFEENVPSLRANVVHVQVDVMYKLNQAILLSLK